MEKNNPSEMEILTHKVGNLTIKDMTAITFCGWLSKKINNQPVTAQVQELALRVSAPPMSMRMSDDEKIRLVMKLLALGVSI